MCMRVCSVLIRGPQDGVLVPIPQYPLYSAAIQLLGGSLVGYYLHEETGWCVAHACCLTQERQSQPRVIPPCEGADWMVRACAGRSLDFDELDRAVADAKRKGVTVRGMVFINPGNPTGQCLTRDDLEKLVRYCHRNKLAVMADEVYQENIYQVGRDRHARTLPTLPACPLMPSPDGAMWLLPGGPPTHRRPVRSCRAATWR